MTSDSDKMEKYRILHAEEADTIANRVLWDVFNPSPSHHVLREWITTFCKTGPGMAGLLKVLRDAELHGTPPEQIPLDEDGLAFLDRVLISKREAWEDMDDLSEVGSKIAPTGHGGRSISFRVLTTPGAVILDALEATKEAGGFLGVHGGPVMGKTGFCLRVGELFRAVHPEAEFLTNAPVVRPPPGVVYVETIFDVFQHIADARAARRRWCWNIEEASLAGFVRAKGASSPVIDFQRFVRIIPKLGGSLLVDEHREEDVPSVLAAFTKYNVTCVRPGFAIASLPDYHGAISGIPKPTIVYESGQPAPFSVPDTWDWDAIFRALRYDPNDLTLEDAPGEVQAQRIRQALADMGGGEPLHKRPPVRCRHCGYEWEPRTDAPPAQCPRCRKGRPVLEAAPATNGEASPSPATPPAVDAAAAPGP